jgi:hypothetical protein
VPQSKCGLLRFARNDVRIYVLILAARCVRVLSSTSRPPSRGRRECRALDAPAARRAEKNSHASIVTTVTPVSPDIPRAMVYGFLRALPGDQDLLTPSSADNSTDLTPTSRRQDHTTSPSTSAALVLRASASIASNPAFVTLRNAPPWGGCDACSSEFQNCKAKYFCQRDWTTQITLMSFGKLVFTCKSKRGA